MTYDPFNLPTDEEILEEALRETLIAQRQRELEEHQRLRLCRRDNGICENCGTTEETALRPARTAYHYEGADPDLDPNRDWMSCPSCDELDREYWDGQWAEYYSGRL